MTWRKPWVSPSFSSRCMKTFRGTARKNSVYFCGPTSNNYEQFGLTLDKLLSDNINRQFFKGDIPLEQEIIRGEGLVEVQQSVAGNESEAAESKRGTQEGGGTHI